jgi:hypothetical protein
VLQRALEIVKLLSQTGSGSAGNENRSEKTLKLQKHAAERQKTSP